MYVIDIHKIMYVCMYVYYESSIHTYYAYELVLASTRVLARVLYIILTIYFNMRTISSC